MEEPLWQFKNVPIERCRYLLTPFTFPTLIKQICSEVRDVRYKTERGSIEAKGSWRPVFWFDVAARTFDSFFNSPFGYRGQYLRDQEDGNRQNNLLISALAEHLIQSVTGEGSLVDQVPPLVGFAACQNLDR